MKPFGSTESGQAEEQGVLFTEACCLSYRNSASNENFIYRELEAFWEMCLLNIETSAEKSCGCVNGRGNGVRSLKLEEEHVAPPTFAGRELIGRHQRMPINQRGHRQFPVAGSDLKEKQAGLVSCGNPPGNTCRDPDRGPEFFQI